MRSVDFAPASGRDTGDLPRAPGRRVVLRALLAGAVGSGLAGCEGVAVSVADPRLTPDALADRYVRLTLELARHQPSLVDVWLGPASTSAGPRRPVAAIRAETSALVGDLDSLTTAVDAVVAPAPPPAIAEATRLRYLAGQAHALDTAAARLLGESMTFEDEARRAFGHTAPPRDSAALDALRTELARLLPGPGSLADRHAAFRRRSAVPRDRVEPVFRAAVDWCRTAARAHLPLPPGEALATRAEDTTGWAAFSKPTGALTSDLWVANGGGADAAHLLQLAAHEGTPGHHAQHVLASAQLVTARGWSERRLHPSFGPHRLFAEGAAEAGADLLLPLAVREQVCREVLLPAAGQRPDTAGTLVQVERLVAALDLEVAYVAADYLDGSLAGAAATIRLRDDALVLDPAGMLGFLERQRTRVLAYPVGRRLVTAALGEGPAATRWTRLGRVATNLMLDPVN